MIKTHRPRGHIWTHASAFQQTKEFRHIDFEECTLSQPKVLARDSDDALTGKQRAAKRRRVEKLADDFLNGVPLFIASARPCPRSLEHTIVHNQRAQGVAKTCFPDTPASAKDDGASTAVWEDMEDDDELFVRLCRSLPTATRHANSDQYETNYDAAALQIVEAKASCSPVRRLRQFKVSTGPSVEALSQAAALRARKMVRSRSELPVRPGGSSSPIMAAGNLAEPRSEPHYEILEVSNNTESERWLSRRKSRFSFSQYANDDGSQDDLCLPYSDTSSRPLQTCNAVRAGAMHSTAQDDQPYVERSKKDSLDFSERSSGPVDLSPASAQHTELTRPAEDHSTDGLSQSNASYQTVPEKSIGRERVLEGTITRRPDSSSKTPEAAQLNPSSVDPSSLPHAFKELTTRSYTLSHAKSAGRDIFLASPPSRRTRSAVAKMVLATNGPGSKAVHMSAPSSQTQTTPFAFHKLLPRPEDREMPQLLTPAPLPRNIRNAMQLPSSETLEIANAKCPASNNLLSTETTVVDLSCDQNSASTRDSKTIDAAGEDGNRESSGCERLARADSHALEFPSGDSTNKRPHSLRTAGGPTIPSLDRPTAPSPIWAGTQFLLDKAQHDLFMSPDKSRLEASEADLHTPHFSAQAARPRLSSGRRKSGVAILDEFKPSTQQLLGNFEGWSTVKKPGFLARESLLPTPTTKSRSSLGHGSSLRRVSSSAPLSRCTADETTETAISLHDSIASTNFPQINRAQSSHGSMSSHAIPQRSTSRSPRRISNCTGNIATSSTDIRLMPSVGPGPIQFADSVLDGTNSDVSFRTSFQAAQRELTLTR